MLLAGCAGGAQSDRGDRFEFADFEGGMFDEPEYQFVYATCPPERRRLAVRFDPARALVILDGERIFASLSAEGAQIGCADARLEDPSGRGWRTGGLAGPVEDAIAVECRVDGRLEIVTHPIFGPGERDVVGGSLIVATPVPRTADHMLIASSYEEDGPSTLHYRRGRCRATG